MTDFGLKDHYVGTMYGVIKSFSPESEIIDITHHVRPQNIKEGLYRLLDCYEYFPAGTVFLAVIDPGVGTHRDILLVETEAKYFMAPDNGLLTPFLEGSKEQFKLKKNPGFFSDTSNTFHGRDLFSPFAALVDSRTYEEYVVRVTENSVKLDYKPDFKDDSITGEVAYSDWFGNIVSNIYFDDIPYCDFHVRVGKSEVMDNFSNYSEATEDSLFYLRGSSGRLEVSLKNGSAADVLGEKVQVVKIINDCENIR